MVGRFWDVRQNMCLRTGDTIHYGCLNTPILLKRINSIKEKKALTMDESETLLPYNYTENSSNLIINQILLYERSMHNRHLLDAFDHILFVRKDADYMQHVTLKDLEIDDSEDVESVYQTLKEIQFSNMGSEPTKIHDNVLFASGSYRKKWSLKSRAKISTNNCT